jgi:hypothetical protein
MGNRRRIECTPRPDDAPVSADGRNSIAAGKTGDAAGCEVCEMGGGETSGARIEVFDVKK